MHHDFRSYLLHSFRAQHKLCSFITLRLLVHRHIRTVQLHPVSHRESDATRTPCPAENMVPAPDFGGFCGYPTSDAVDIFVPHSFSYDCGFLSETDGFSLAEELLMPDLCDIPKENQMSLTTFTPTAAQKSLVINPFAPESDSQLLPCRSSFLSAFPYDGGDVTLVKSEAVFKPSNGLEKNSWDCQAEKVKKLVSSLSGIVSAAPGNGSTSLVDLSKIEKQQCLARSSSNQEDSSTESSTSTATAGATATVHCAVTSSAPVVSVPNPKPFHHKSGGPCDHCGATGRTGTCIWLANQRGMHRTGMSRVQMFGCIMDRCHTICTS